MEQKILNNKKQKPEIGDVYQESFKILKDNIVICIANTLIAFIAIVLFAITILGILAVPAIAGGYIHSFLRMSNGEKVEIGDFFKYGFNKFGRLLIAGIIYPIGVMLGFICFIIPGIYLMIRWFFIVPLIMDKDLGVAEAFDYSGRMSDGILWDIFSIFILNAIIKGVGGLIVIGSIFTSPLTYIVICRYYVLRINYLSEE